MCSSLSILKTLLPISTAILLASCSDSGPTAHSGFTDAQPRQFSEADKIAARALSIGNERALSDIEDPSAQAQMCNIAIDGIITMLREAGSLTNAQLSALESARLFYARQAPPAQANGSSEEQAATDIPDEAGEPETDSANHARIAIACLRRLQ